MTCSAINPQREEETSSFLEEETSSNRRHHGMAQLTNLITIGGTTFGGDVFSGGQIWLWRNLVWANMGLGKYESG